MRSVMTILAAIALLGLGLPAAATGQSNGGVDEYEEVLPGPGGNESSGGADGGDDSSGPLTPAQVSALEGQGSDGAAAAELAGRTGGEQDRGSGGDPVTSTADAPDDDSGVAEVVGDLASGSGGGMGIVLPIVLVAALVAAIGYVVARRRGGPADPA